MNDHRAPCTRSQNINNCNARRKMGQEKKNQKKKNNRKGQPTHWLENVSKNLQDRFALEFCPLSPCLAKKPKMTAIIHVDDMIWWFLEEGTMNHFLFKAEEKCNISVNIVEKPGDSISFLLKRSYVRVSDDWWWCPVAASTTCWNCAHQLWRKDKKRRNQHCQAGQKNQNPPDKHKGCQLTREMRKKTTKEKMTRYCV